MPAAGTPLTVKTHLASVVFNRSGDATVLYAGGAFSSTLVAVNASHPSTETTPMVPWKATRSACNLRCYQPSGDVLSDARVATNLVAIGV